MKHGLEAQSKTADLERVLDLDTVMEFSDTVPVLLGEVSVVVNTQTRHLHKIAVVRSAGK